jgi:hypothetical protein
MNWTSKVRGAVAMVVALLVGIVLGMNLLHPDSGLAQKQPNVFGQRYTVIHTEGTNIAVTDNKTNTVYYYTVDPGAEPGSDLKLRGSLDLNQVGEQVIKPKLFKK